MTLPTPCNPVSRGNGRRRRAVQHAVLALGLAASGWADACTLDALLRMPLEQLLRLDVALRRLAQNGSGHPTEPAGPMPDGERNAA